MLSLFLLVSAALATPPNLVFISVDTLRVDRLGCYGSAAGLSPNIDALAARSLLFEDMICEQPQTGPSMISMFTSLFPRMTGTVRNSVPLGKGVSTAPLRLRETGYETLAVVSNWNLKGKLSGLDRGFEVYEDTFEEGRWGGERVERYAEEVTDAALALLARRDAQRPLFLWVHYMDPHDPYRLHDRHGPGLAALRRMNSTERARARYDSEVAHMDEHLGRLLREIDLDTTWVVLTADHGESLNEHGYMGHTRKLYQQMMHVPLLISGPGLTPGRTAVPARGIDIGTTLLGIAGAGPAPGMLGLDLLRNPPGSERIRVVETFGGTVPTSEEGRAQLATRPPRLQAVLRDTWKLILGEQVQLFDLVRDPLELRDLEDTHPAEAETLAEEIATWSTQVPRGESDAAELTQEDIDALRATGYL